MSYPDPYMQGFMQAMSSETKGVFIRHLFIDINDGYLSDSIAFSHLCYMFSRLEDPDFSHRTLVQRDGYDWLALSHSDWWEACRINKNTIRTVIKRMAERGFILTDKGQTGTSKIVTVLIRPDFQAISSALQSAKPRSKRSDGSDRNDQRPRSKRSDGSDRNDQKPRSKRSDGSDRNDQMGVIETIRSSLYIENIKEVDQESKKDPERARGNTSVKIASCEIVSEPEGIQADRTSYPGPQTLLVNPSNLVGDNFSAMGPVAPIDSAAVVSRFKPGSMAFAGECMGLPGYEAFESIYREGVARLQAHYGDVALAKTAWAQAWQGLYPPEWFWAGLNIYLDQRRESFVARAGNSYACSGHRLLADEASRIKDAIAIQEARSEALSIGLDLTNPIAIERANSEINRKKNGQDWMEYRRQKELREAEGVA